MHNNDWNWLLLTKSPTKAIDWPFIDSMNALGCIWGSSQFLVSISNEWTPNQVAHSSYNLNTLK
jgi:hypothetical protein